MAFAKRFDDFPSLAEVISGHCREEVVLDLIVEAAIPETDKRAGLYVASGKDLVVQIVEGIVLVGDEHPFVIRGKYRAEVQAKQQLMDQGKAQNLPRTEYVEQQSKVQAKVDSHERGID